MLDILKYFWLSVFKLYDKIVIEFFEVFKFWDKISNFTTDYFVFFEEFFYFFWLNVKFVFDVDEIFLILVVFYIGVSILLKVDF